MLLHVSTYGLQILNSNFRAGDGIRSYFMVCQGRSGEEVLGRQSWGVGRRPWASAGFREPILADSGKRPHKQH